MTVNHDLLLSDTAIISVPNCPEEIRRCGNLPWHYVGDIAQTFQYNWLEVFCVSRICFQPLDICAFVDFSLPVPKLDRFMASLQAYHFITSDLLVITVYFGQCQRCNAVYWGKKGPPYSRLRRFVPAMS